MIRNDQDLLNGLFWKPKFVMSVWDAPVAIIVGPVCAVACIIALAVIVTYILLEKCYSTTVLCFKIKGDFK
jgi:hypothetical protein